MIWAFERLADLAALRQAFRRIQAHLLEFWLFVDDPGLVGKSWRGLLAANGRFLRALLPPLVVLSAALAPVFLLLDARYGTAPLPVGRPAVVTVALERPTASPSLGVPDGVALESPPVRVPAVGEVSWRIRPLRALSGELRCRIAGAEVEKAVEAGSGHRWVAPRRTRSLAGWLLHPGEARLETGVVRSIEIGYPAAAVTLFGIKAHWSLWFFGFSLAGAILGARLW